MEVVQDDQDFLEDIGYSAPPISADIRRYLNSSASASVSNQSTLTTEPSDDEISLDGEAFADEEFNEIPFAIDDGYVPEIPPDMDAYFSECADAGVNDGYSQQYVGLPVVDTAVNDPTLLGDDFRKNLLDGLNECQAGAVSLSVDAGPVMVLAGAGSGKTAVLTKRIAWLVSRGVNPKSILAVTFTNKAAKEMKERLHKLGAGQPQMGTFHQIGLKIIKMCPEIIGVRSGFSISDSHDAKQMWRNLFVVSDKEGVKSGELKFIKSDKNLWSQYETAMFKAKDAGVRSAAELKPCGDEAIDMHDLGRIVDAYETERKRCNKVDFADMIAGSLLAILENPAAQRWAAGISHVLVDEFQDTSDLQFEWATSILGRKHLKQNLFLVGDDCQSIYAFRGAKVANIDKFISGYSAHQVLLEQNYRCGSKILDAANSLIKNNKGGDRKRLWTENKAGEVVVEKFYRDDEEAAWIATNISSLARERGQDAVAVLLRTKAAMMPVARALRERQIVHHIVGATDFFKTKEVRDALSLLRLVVNPMDTISFTRAAEIFDGVGKKAVFEAVKKADALGVSPIDVAHESKKLMPVALLYEGCTSNDPARATASRLICDSGLMAQCSEGGEEVRLRNILEFIEIAGQFETVGVFMEEITLFAESSNDLGGVTLSTIHAAKGLEWDRVYLPAVCEGHLPMANNEDGGEDEERRLMYVAITRARRSLKVSFARRRMINGKVEDARVSKFIGEMGG